MSGGEFSLALLVAVVLGALCWVGCSYYTRLWHRRFHVRPQHHLLCAVAAILTVIFTVQFRAVGNLEYIVDHIIDDWYENLLEDGDFYDETFEIAFYAVKDEFPNAFRGVAEPGNGGSTIPIENDGMMLICIQTYVEETCANFSTRHPFLNMMLKARPGLSAEEMERDMRAYFERHNDPYPAERAVEIAAEHILENLLTQSPKTVWKTRLILVFLFFGVQLIPFGTIGLVAYEDLKRGRHIPKNEEDYYY